jgi:ABC-2 type transport system permease protein
MRKVMAVARYEFVGAVTRPGYLLTLIGLPLFIASIAVLVSLANMSMVRETLARNRLLGLVDESRLFEAAPTKLETELVPAAGTPGGTARRLRRTDLMRFVSFEEARAALQRGEVTTIVRIPSDYLNSGKLQEYVSAKRELDLTAGQSGAAALLRPWLVRGLLQGRVADAVAARAAEPSRLERFVIDPSGRTSAVDLLRDLRPLLVPLGFALLLFIAVFTSASYLATGLAEEKQNRALELLLTSITPDQLFWGKLLGLWCASLLQFGLYLLLVALPAGLVFKALALHPSHAVVGLCYFVLGFFFFGAVLLMVGSIGNTQKYTQQLSAVFTLTALIPLMMIAPLLGHPQGALARTLTYIPFTAPVTGLLRFGADALPWWEFALSLGVLTISASLVIRVCARIFRVALLATGSTPNAAQLWRWLRTG